MIIELTPNLAFGEPGPNLCWFGEPLDFLHLMLKLHCLGMEKDCTIEVVSDDFVSLYGFSKLILKSTSKGSTLCKLSPHQITIDIEHKLWREILRMTLEITFEPSYVFIEFDDLDLIEEANIVFNSLDKSAHAFFKELGKI